MNLSNSVFVALFAIATFTSSVQAQGTNAYSANYPKPGAAGTMLVKGTASPAMGWQLGVPHEKWTQS
jgi:hypothetical protein